MSKLTTKQVLHTANISALKLSKSEIKKFTPQLDKIIEFVGTLNEVDTTDTKPTAQTTGLSNVLRDDIVKTDEQLDPDAALSGTNNSHNGLFKVPAILTERTDE